MQILRPNRACCHDQIINEFLKPSAGKMIAIYAKSFNLTLCSGKTPDEWSLGMIKPILKQKGSSDDPDNYRGRTILSCFGKLFTSVINIRLAEYCDENSTIGSEQAGFRAGHSTVDHMFTLYCIIDFFLSKKKRLYCLFVDYEQVFACVKRAFLRQKLLDSSVNGRILTVIKDMCQKAKSCVNIGDNCSDYFQCYLGVRQGENLSPVLFAIYLNDLQTFMAERIEGLSSLGRESRKLGWENENESLMLKMLILLHADGTTICAESAVVLQQALEATCDYCGEWSLRVNVKTHTDTDTQTHRHTHTHTHT